jgi:hypothetical protein
LLCLAFWAVGGMAAQKASSIGSNASPYENILIESKWRYTYTLQVESNTVIHQADKKYNYYLYLKYDFTYWQYLNGQTSKGTWSVNDDVLFYNFRNIKKFTLEGTNFSTLVLEFTQPNSKGTYQYHFVRITNKEAPFARAANELPEVSIQAKNFAQLESAGPSAAAKRRRERSAKVVESPKEPTYISIELVGGGFYGGVDPVLRDYIQIKSNGRLIKEFKSVQKGLIVTKRDLTRAELEEFMEFVISKNFFEMDRIYDCKTEDCQARKRRKPAPIPLRLAIAYGSQKQVVTITIWGIDDYRVQYIDYPKQLDEIIKYIQLMADSPGS